MLRWFHTSGKVKVGMGQICQYGPNALRPVGLARQIMGVLADYGWVVPILGGTKIDGKYHREAWEIVKD